MRRILTFFCLSLLLLLACDGSVGDQAQTEIRDIIYDISRDFSWNDIEGIMAHVHPEYLHNGVYREEFRQLWMQRRAQYQLLDCTVSQVDIQDDHATVHLRLDFTATDGDLSYEDPQTSGDISFFVRDNGVWQIYGNQSR